MATVNSTEALNIVSKMLEGLFEPAKPKPETSARVERPNRVGMFDEKPAEPEDNDEIIDTASYVNPLAKGFLVERVAKSNIEIPPVDKKINEIMGINYHENMVIYRAVGTILLRKLMELPFNSLAVEGPIGVSLYNYNEKMVSIVPFDEYLEIIGTDIYANGEVTKMTIRRWEEINGITAPQYVLVLSTAWIRNHNELEHPAFVIGTFISMVALRIKDGDGPLEDFEKRGYCNYYKSDNFMKRAREGF